jgi:hypothetical protein
VRLLLGEPTLVDDLLEFLERRECVGEHLAAVVEVELPAGLDDERARMELDLLLRVWQARHEGVAVEVVG